MRSSHKLASFYRRFIRDFSIPTTPLTNLVKKNFRFKGEGEQKMASKLLMARLISTPSLALPNFSKMFKMECDAFRLSIGAVFMQENRPIAYCGKELNEVAFSFPIYDKELYALVWALET